MVIVLMGVSGSGKTTVGRALADDLGWPFYDGDDFHSRANVEKMRGGTPLTDIDRAAWLDALRATIETALAADQPTVVACSALKEAYRTRLAVDPARVHFVYLRGAADLLARRLRLRTGHFMPASLLGSQLATLEEPAADVPRFDAALSPAEIVTAIERTLGLGRS